jgi:glycine cleavage system H protein
VSETAIDTRYSADHLWIRDDGESVTIGITEKVSRILTWVHTVALPPPGTSLEPGDELVEIDSQKTDISIPAPTALLVVAVNDALSTDPMQVRMDPRGQGWLLTAKLAHSDWKGLLSPTEYEALLEAKQ